MLLSTLYWPDEVRDVGELQLPEVEPEFKPAELDMARQLVDTLTGEFDGSRYRDDYREALLAVIEAKAAGQPVEAPAPTPAPSKLTDLMAVLEASVAAAREEAQRTRATADPGQPAAATVPLKRGRKPKPAAASAASTSSAPSRRRKTA